MNYPTDRKGNEISPGVRVAFNLSGAVALGTVRDVTWGYRYSRKLPIIRIDPDKEWGRMTGRSGSTVRNIDGIVAIAEPFTAICPDCGIHIEVETVG